MKKGMLITNGFVGEESFKSLFRALMEAAEKESIAIEQQSNDSLLFDIASGEPLFDIDRYSFGKQVYLADTEEQAAEIIRSHEATPMIMQQAVRESFGRDVRIYVVGGEVMGAMRRSNDRDFRANIANGGSAEAYVPSDEEKHLALEAVRLLGLDFGGVDILHSQEGPLLCEVNSNAHFAGMEKSTGADISGAVMRYIRSELEK